MTTPATTARPARPVDCSACSGAHSDVWARWRRAAAALCGPHPEVSDVPCPRCAAAPDVPCTGRSDMHARRWDRWSAAHERWAFLTSGVADALEERDRGGHGYRTVLATARRDADLLTARLAPAGLRYVVPDLDEVAARAAELAELPAAGGPS